MPAVIARKNRMIRIFRNANATDLAHAISPEDYGVRKFILFNKMVSDGIFLDRGDGSFYLNEERAAILSRQKRKAGLILISVVFIIILLIAIFSRN